jgi:hypothetical protein
VDTFTKPWQALVTKGDSAWRLHRKGDSDSIDFGNSYTDGTYNDNPASGNVDDSSWHHAAAVIDGRTKSFYLDGAHLGDVTLGGDVAQNNYSVAVGENLQAAGRFWHGRLDELRISGQARGAAYVDAEHRSMTGGLVELGTTENRN